MTGQQLRDLGDEFDNAAYLTGLFVELLQYSQAVNLPSGFKQVMINRLQADRKSFVDRHEQLYHMAEHTDD